MYWWVRTNSHFSLLLNNTRTPLSSPPSNLHVVFVQCSNYFLKKFLQIRYFCYCCYYIQSVLIEIYISLPVFLLNIFFLGLRLSARDHLFSPWGTLFRHSFNIGMLAVNAYIYLNVFILPLTLKDSLYRYTILVGSNFLLHFVHIIQLSFGFRHCYWGTYCYSKRHSFEGYESYSLALKTFFVCGVFQYYYHLPGLDFKNINPSWDTLCFLYLCIHF